MERGRLEEVVADMLRGAAKRTPEKARAMRAQKTARELAEQCGVSVRTIQRWTATPRAEWLSQAEKRRAEIRALAAAHPDYTSAHIADRLGVNRSTVTRALKRA